MTQQQLPDQCRECPYWRRDETGEGWPWDSPWGDCEKLSDDDNPVIEYDVPLHKCPLRGKVIEEKEK